MQGWKLANAVCLLVGLGVSAESFAQGKDLAAVVPAAYPLCVTVPNLKQAYERYQATGVGQMYSSPAMAPFVAELRKTGAISLVNWQGILGFDDKLLSQFPGPAAMMAIPPKQIPPPAAAPPVRGKAAAPRPPKPRGNVIFLIETADAAAIGACLKNAEAYHLSQKAVKAAETIPGTTSAVVFSTPKSEDHPALQHVYFTTATQFGVGSNLAVVKEYLALKLKPEETLAANEHVVSGRKQLPAKADVFIYSRPIETLDLWEDYPKDDEKSTAGKLNNQGFRNLKAITGTVQFTGAAHDLDFKAIMFVKEPPPAKAGDAPRPKFTRGMRILNFSPGKEQKAPDWLPAGLGELSQFNHDQEMLYLARANWYDELENVDDGFFLGLMDDLKREQTGVKVDFRKDIFAKLKPAQFHAIDVHAAKTAQNLLGKTTIKISEMSDVPGVTAALTKFYQNDAAVTKETVNGAQLWWVPPSNSLLIKSNKMSGMQVTTMAIIGDYYVTGNDTGFVRTLANKAGGLAGDAVLANLAAEIRKLETPATGARSGVRWEEMWAAPFEAVRSADPKYDKEREVKMLRTILTGDNTIKYARLYQLLPPFSAVKAYLSPVGSVSDMVSDGLEVKGFILKPQGAGGPMKTVK